MRRTVVLAIALALVLSATAFAKIPSGKWTGSYGTDGSSKVTFTVKHHAMHDFSAFVPAYCTSLDPSYPSTYKFVTFFVPKAAIKNGKVKKTYTVKQNGQTTGTLHLTAKFSGSHATGTLSGTYTGCTIAKYNWQADHS